MIKNLTKTFANLLHLLVIVIIISSCGSVKKVKWSTDDISVKEAYVQKYVPGQEDGGDPITYLFIDIDILDSTIVLDSAMYDNYTIPVSDVRLPLKINWVKGRNCNCDTSYKDKAIIYYTKDKKRFKRIVEGIKIKEDLYLP